MLVVPSSLLCAALVSLSPIGGEGQITITAERVLHDGRADRTTAEGHAVLRGTDLAITADRVVYDRAQSAVTATGHVVARITQGGLLAVTADVVTVRLDGDEVRELFLLDGRAVSKVDTTKEALLAAETAEAIDATGRTNALLQGNHLSRDGPRWDVDHLELVPCECDFKEPSWSISASSASIDTEAERVSVVSPVVRVKQLPVLWLPWLSLPMTDRQTGLLFPRPNYTQLNGFSLEQPVFLTLGRSADLTLTPGFFTGGTGDYGLAGPRLLGELRYVPSQRAQGRLSLGILYDARAERDPVTPSLKGPDPRGVRGEGSWQHLQDFDHGFGLRVDAKLYSDGFYNRDVTPDVVASTNGYLRSTALATQRSADHLVSLDVTLRQELAYGYTWLGRQPELSSSTAPRYGPNPLQRLPALTFTLPTKRLAGPLAIDVQADAVRLSPLFGLTGDESPVATEGRLTDDTGSELEFQCLRERLYFPEALSGACGVTAADKVGQGDRVFQPGEREARDRLSLLPRLSVAGTPGDVVSLSAFAGYRQSLWLGEVTGRTWQRGYPLLGARVETELARSFAGGALRHAITPVVEVRAVPAVVRGSNNAELEPVPYDEVDRSIPNAPAGAATARVQAIAEVRQRLGRAGGAGPVFRFDLGQGFDFVAPERTGPALAESYGRATFSLGWVNAGATVRVDPVTPRLTRLSATCGVDDGRGHAAYAAYDNLLDDGSNRTRAPVDLLFGPMVPSGVQARSNILSAGARWQFGTVGLRYDALLLDRLWGTEERFSLAQHTVGVSWAPACDCWRLEVFATQRPRTDGTWAFPDVGATLTVSRFGSIGVASP
ncbi:MAG: LPS assembly protein LptD [Myxococcales bacterium]|nr:LPS assembly protein LptD [Myxococcales bacterium]